MRSKFSSYYQENNLFTKEDKVLLAVSGGKDSMAMVHLFEQEGLSVGIAHCNFQLRGKDADLDEQLVKDFSLQHNIPFYSIRFNTEHYAKEHGISVQMAARDLRYNWFEKIRDEHNYQYVATAHHKNDVAETMLINLTKGTGLSGLHGIQKKNKEIIRPLLCFSAQEIEDYIVEKGIVYREDLSNAETKYFRNAIRHKVIPELKKLNPSVIETLNEDAERLANVEVILEQKIDQEKEECFDRQEDYIAIDIEKLKRLSPLSTYLYYFLKPYGFNFSNINDIIAGLSNQSGQTYTSHTHVLIKDRNQLLLKSREEESFAAIQISSFTELPFKSEILEVSDKIEFNPSNTFAYLDEEKIGFPMELRAWKEGDTFQPLGMKGNKKVSDFLIDEKVSILDKKKVKVLESDGQIVWLVGFRIDDNYKITPTSKRALVLSTDHE